jgi:hypothetical protein
MSLTESQKKRYNTYRAEGMAPDRALGLATKQSDNQFNPVMQQGLDKVLFGKGSLTEAVGAGIKEAAVGGVRQIAKDTEEFGGGFAAVKAPLSLLAGVGRGAEKVIGGVLETADDLTGEVVSDFAAPLVEEAVNSKPGQYMINKAMEWDEKARGIPGDILDVTALTGIVGALKSGTAKSIKTSIVNQSKKTFDSAAEKAVNTTVRLKDSLRRTPAVKPDAPGTPAAAATVVATAEDKALGAAAELLQSGSKKSAQGRAAKYNNADTQAMKVIRDSDVDLNSQQDLADFFGTEVTKAVAERDALLRPFLTNSVDDSYQAIIKEQIKTLRVAGDLDEATKYAQFLKKESDLFDKIGKAAPGGKNTVAQLNDRIKEINKKVTKLFDDAGGKENLLPDQKIEAQAYDLIRQGIKKELDEIGGEEYATAGLKTSGLLDAQTFSRIQRDRAKNALTGTPWEKMTAVQRAAFVKDFFPTLKDFGVSKLVKLDTKADVLDALVAEKVRLIREFGADAVNAAE